MIEITNVEYEVAELANWVVLKRAVLRFAHRVHVGLTLQLSGGIVHLLLYDVEVSKQSKIAMERQLRILLLQNIPPTSWPFLSSAENSVLYSSICFTTPAKMECGQQVAIPVQ